MLTAFIVISRTQVRPHRAPSPRDLRQGCLCHRHLQAALPPHPSAPRRLQGTHLYRRRRQLILFSKLHTLTRSEQVVGRDGFLVAAESTYSVPSGSITRYALGLGYAAPAYTVTLQGLANLSVFSASYYHKVNKDVEAGAKAIWDSKSTTSNVGLEVGGKAYLDVRLRSLVVPIARY